LKTTGYQTYKRSEESQSIIQIIRPAEESDLWRKEEGFKRTLGKELFLGVVPLIMIIPGVVPLIIIQSSGGLH